jgi:hypothetical protein
LQPGEIFVQPVTGFHVNSVHSISELDIFFPYYYCFFSGVTPFKTPQADTSKIADYYRFKFESFYAGNTSAPAKLLNQANG